MSQEIPYKIYLDEKDIPNVCRVREAAAAGAVSGVAEGVTAMFPPDLKAAQFSVASPAQASKSGKVICAPSHWTSMRSSRNERRNMSSTSYSM